MFIAAMLTFWIAVCVAWAPWRLSNLDVVWWKTLGYFCAYGVGLWVMVWHGGTGAEYVVQVIMGVTLGTVAGLVVGEGLLAWAKVGAETRAEELMEAEGLSYEQH